MFLILEVKLKIRDVVTRIMRKNGVEIIAAKSSHESSHQSRLQRDSCHMMMNVISIVNLIECCFFFCQHLITAHLSTSNVPIVNLIVVPNLEKRDSG